jgi:hypothetical protein
MNLNKCIDCNSNNATIKYEEKFYCPSCAQFLLTKLKNEYYQNKNISGWKINELWQQLHVCSNNLDTQEAESFLEEDEILKELNEYLDIYYRPIDAKVILRNFIKDNLDNNIDNLIDYDFNNLKYDLVYGCQNPEHFDCDNTYIMKAIYQLLFSQVFPAIDDWRHIGSGKAFRGDTINTFHTLFGREIPEKKGYFYGIEKFAPIDENLYQKIRKFKSTISTIGNFVVLPNYSYWNGRQNVTINTYRGCNNWRDYFDQFMIALEECLCNKSSADQTLYNLIYQRNHQAFEPYTSFDGFVKLANNLLLDDYLDENNHAKNLFTSFDGEVFYHWENPQKVKDIYLAGVENYLTCASKIIQSRSQRMVNLLKELC